MTNTTRVRALLELSVNLELAKVSSGWRATTDPLAITVYARTEKAVVERARKAISSHLEAANDNEDMIAYLERHTLKYSVSYQIEEDSIKRISTDIEMPMMVLA